MKKIRVLLSIILLSFLIIILTACRLINTSNNKNSVNGTYYLYENEALDKTSFIDLSSDKWTSDDGSGTYSINGTNIVFYIEDEKLYEGTISNGKLTITFMGVTTTYYKEGIEPSGSTTNIDNSIVITFDLNGGSFETSSNVINIEKDSLVTKPENPTKSGFVFLGWAKDNNGSTYWDFDLDRASLSMTLYAIWEEANDSNSVLLRFESNGGTEVNEQRILIGNSPTKPKDPSRDGYIFDGWYSDSSFSKVFNFDTLLSSNKTIYAKWAIKCIVNFYNYDDALIKSYEVKQGSSIVFDGITPKKDLNDGKTYKFIGWDHNTTSILSDLNIYAIYEEVKAGNNGFEYRLSSDKTYYIITGIGDIDSEEVIIPTEFNNLPIKEIDDEGLAGLTNARKIIIQSNIVKIGKGALNGASHLEEIELPYVGLTKNGNTNNHFGYIFGSNSFDNSSAINIGSESILYIPANLKTITINGGMIPNNAFSGMYNTKVSNIFLNEAVEGATYYSFGATLDHWKLYIASSEDNPKYEKEMGPVTYFDAYKENLIVIDGITYLLQNNKVTVTDANKTLTNVSIPYSVIINDNSYNVTKIGKRAFRQCLNIESINLSNGIKYIDDSAFAYCNSLTSITLPSSLHEIGNSVFENCVSLPSISLPNNVEKIGNNAFKNCYEITTITLNIKLEYIDYYAFKNCSKLETLSIPNSVYYIGGGAFEGCSKLTYNKITSGDGMGNYLGNSSNQYLWLIKATGTDTKYVMNNNTKHIYSNAFSGLQSINNMKYTLSNNLETIGANAFGNTKFTSINIPSSVYYIGNYVFSGKEITTIELPDGLIYLGEGAFSNCTELEEITIPDDILIIRESTFEGCTNLKDVHLSKNLITLEAGAFSNCESLDFIILAKNIENAGKNVFKGDYSLTIYIEGYKIPSGFDDEFNPSNANIIFVNLDETKSRIYIDNQIKGIKIDGVISGNEYNYNSNIEISARNIPTGYTIKWIRSDGISKVGDGYSFKTPIYDLTITITVVIPNYKRVDNKIYFGSYPQTNIKNESLINELNVLAGDLPTADDKKNWIDYNYYDYNHVSSYMFYQDIDYDNDGNFDYRGVFFTKYRPDDYTLHADENHSSVSFNNYKKNNIYWFIYESIEWNILYESNGKALIIANLILDNQEIYSGPSKVQFEHNGGTGYSNNYELSYIRKWLNEDFYNTAFNDLQKDIIEITEVDNSSESTGKIDNDRVCKNTNDKMFLLSYAEAITYYDSAESRLSKTSDYANIQNARHDVSGDYVEYSYWWLRSPIGDEYNNSDNYLVSNDITSYKFTNTNIYAMSSDTNDGVRPVCVIKLL